MRFRNVTSVLLLALCSNALANRVEACRHAPYAEARWEMRLLMESVQAYQEAHGPLKPVNDAGVPWNEALAASEAGQQYFVADILARQPLTILDMPIVYDPSGAIRCVGPNGVDDGGAFDDWEARFHPILGRVSVSQPNWVTWYADEYAAAKSIAALRGALVAVVGVVIGFTLRRWFVAAFVTTGCYGMLFLNIRATVAPVYRWPYWVELAEGSAMLALTLTSASALAWMFLAMTRAGHRTVRALSGHHCEHCGYDLTGLTGLVCPECGGQIKKSQPMTFHP